MKLSKQLFQQKMRKPNKWESLNTDEAIKQAGFVEFLDAGFPYYSPVGQKIKMNLEKVLADSCEKNDFVRVLLPSVHRKELVEMSGKYNEFKDEFVDVKANYVLTATSEEYFMELARLGLESHNQLPIKLFEIGGCIRFIKRPQGMLKLREFHGAVLASLDKDKKGYETSLCNFRNTVKSVLKKTGISPNILERDNSVEYFYNSLTEDSIKDLSLAMGYLCDVSSFKNVNFRSRDNGLNPITFGTYGIGLERLFYATCDSCRDEKGFNFPEEIRPFDSAIIILDPKDNSQMTMGQNIYSEIGKNGGAYLEDRAGMSYKEKLDYADFLGVKEKIIVGKKETINNHPSIKLREEK